MQRGSIRVLEGIIRVPLLAFILFVLSATASSGADIDYSKVPTEKLIDDLMLVDNEAPALESTANIYDAFIAEDAPLQFSVGVLGSPRPVIPPQMRELVRRGPQALPVLIRHLNDSRATLLKVGQDTLAAQVGLSFFGGQYFSDEYRPKNFAPRRDKRPFEKGFNGAYTVRVGDICYALIGQIVNRPLLSVRYQPTAMMVVNSPLEAPDLITQVRRDWAGVGARGLRDSLLSDLRGQFDSLFDPALARLRLYYPETYSGLRGLDLKKRLAFESDQAEKKRLASLPRPDYSIPRSPLNRNLDSCTTLNACVQVLDMNIHDPLTDWDTGLTDVRVRLQAFGEPAKRELLRRVAGPDRAWRSASGYILGDWPSLGPENLPTLLDSFRMQTGLASAMAIARIDSPVAMRVLIEHFKMSGDTDIVAEALTSAKERALPYLLPLLQEDDDRVWMATFTIIRNMGTEAPTVAENWITVASDARRPRKERIGALRGIGAIGVINRSISNRIEALRGDPDSSVAKLVQQMSQ